MNNYAVFTIKKPKGGLNSVAKHIERTHQPDNARPELSHLNRYDLIEYPPGVKTLAEAVEHRIATAGIGRKIGPNQVRCLTAVMTSDHEAMERIIAEGKFEGWIKDSVDWACERFGRENVVAAVLHMDEYTPHLHVVIVPIVTTERKRKPRESKAKRTYRTKPKNRPRLCADDVMTRDNLERFHDEYAVPMKKYGLKRGIRGSMARHVDQQDYYRQCQREKKSLEEDVAKLSTEKKKLGREKKSLESDKDKLREETKALEADKVKLERGNRVLEVQKSQCEEYNRKVRKENGELTDRNSQLQSENATLADRNSSLAENNEQLADAAANLYATGKQLEMQNSRLMAENTTYTEQAEVAKKEAAAAHREAEEAKAERDRQKKEAVSNIANIFTGSKTKRLEAEIADRDRTIENLEMRLNSQEEDHRREIGNLSDSLRRQKEQYESYERGYKAQMERIDKYFPSVSRLLPAIIDCESVRMSETVIKALLDCKPRVFNSGQTLYDPTKGRDMDVGGTEVQIKSDPTDGNKFRLHINGSRIFQWFKDQWQRLTQKFSRGPHL